LLRDRFALPDDAFDQIEQLRIIIGHMLGPRPEATLNLLDTPTLTQSEIENALAGLNAPTQQALPAEIRPEDLRPQNLRPEDLSPKAPPPPLALEPPARRSLFSIIRTGTGPGPNFQAAPARTPAENANTAPAEIVLNLPLPEAAAPTAILSEPTPEPSAGTDATPPECAPVASRRPYGAPIAAAAAAAPETATADEPAPALTAAAPPAAATASTHAETQPAPKRRSRHPT
jgi:hypothetical protein